MIKLIRCLVALSLCASCAAFLGGCHNDGDVPKDTPSPLSSPIAGDPYPGDDSQGKLVEQR